MGAWSYQLYQTDTALKVKRQLEEALQSGEDIQQITSELTKQFAHGEIGFVEEFVFWLALADSQWNAGLLLPFVKEKALFWISEIAKTSSAYNNALQYLRIQLLSQQPSPRFPRKRNTYRCQWNYGDIYSYSLESETAKEIGFENRYLLFQKVDETFWYPGHIVPVVYVKITRDKTLPKTAKEYDQLEFVQTGFTKYEERTFPIDGTRPNEDIAEKNKISVTKDAFGFLPEYRAILLNTSKRIVSKNLNYVGNLSSTVPPEKEFIPFSNVNLPEISWNLKWESADEKILKWYKGHNLRGFPIYKQNN
ncbi:MAG: hypothetical protein E7680_02455 [Ruminococcaceae bacterium]|nr:hypothetical protein [Oscillospiraceae bacterium]